MTSYSQARFSLLRLFQRAAAVVFAGSFFFSPGASAKSPAGPQSEARQPATAQTQAPVKYFASPKDLTGQLSLNKKPVACAPRQKNTQKFTQKFTHYCWEVTGKDARALAFASSGGTVAVPAPQQRDSIGPAPSGTEDTGAIPAYVQTGKASWYGRFHQGKRMANGESFNMNDPTLAAHRTMRLGTRMEVTVLNPDGSTGKTITVKISDRGPYKRGRIIDLSKAGAEALGFKERGVAPVILRVVSEGKEMAPVSVPDTPSGQSVTGAASLTEKQLSFVQGALARAGVTFDPVKDPSDRENLSLLAENGFKPLDIVKLLKEPEEPVNRTLSTAGLRLAKKLAMPHGDLTGLKLLEDLKTLGSGEKARAGTPKRQATNAANWSLSFLSPT